MSTDESTARPDWLLRLTAGLFAVAGLLLAVPGARLVLLGGSAYYVIAGFTLAAAGVLLWRERMSGAWLFVGVLLATVVWALRESDPLPAGGHAAPMTFYSKRSGRQFVVIPASGHFLMKSGAGDYLVAYALPRS